jgi:hypothetical protein
MLSNKYSAECFSTISTAAARTRLDHRSKGVTRWND